MMRFAKVIVIIMFPIFLWGCNKDKASPIPFIKFVKQSHTTVADSGRLEMPIVFSFDFEDGDADIGPLGKIDPNNPPQNVFFTDSRNSNNIYIFDFPAVPNQVVKEDGIKGSFEVIMPAQFLIARTDNIHKFTDTVIFKVQVRDLGPNQYESNEVFTLPIIIKK